MNSPAEAEVYAALESGLAIAVAGLVDGTDWAVHILFPDGSYRYGWPDQGLIGDFGDDRSRFPGCWGGWREEVEGVLVERAGGAQTRFTRDGQRLIDPSGSSFVRLRDDEPVAPLRGVWRPEASVSPGAAIVFSGTERFETVGGLLGLIAEPRMVADWGSLGGRSLFQWPDSAGSYALEPFTLLLARDDGACINLLRLSGERRMRLGFTPFRRGDG